MTLTIDGVDHTADILAGSGPVVTRTENGGDMMVLSLLNGKGTDNMLSHDYRPGGVAHVPIMPSQIVTFADEHGVTFKGVVSEIVPKHEVIDITAVDAVRVLSKRGSTLYRNYYGGVSRKSCHGGYDNGLYLEVPNNANVQEADWAKNTQRDTKDNARLYEISYRRKFDGSTPIKGTIPTLDMDYLSSVKFAVYGMSAVSAETAGPQEVRVYVDEVLVGSHTEKYVAPASKPLTLYYPEVVMSPPVNIRGKVVRYEIYIGKGLKTGYVRLCDAPGEVMVFKGAFHGDYSDTDLYLTNTSNWVEFHGQKFVSVQGQTIGTQYRLTASSAPGYPDVNDPSEAVPDFPERGRIYYSTPDGMSNTAIMGELIQAGGFTPDIAGPTVPVTEFRASGGYIGDYLQTLADLPDETGAQAVYYSDGDTIRVRRRNKRTERAYAQLHTDLPDLPPETADGERIVYPVAGSFEVRKALRGKPAVVMVKGTKTDTGETGNGTPIMFAVEDTASWTESAGTDAVRVSSASNDYISVAREAYGEVMRNRSRDWEGTVVLDGLHPGLIAEGSGLSLRVFDEASGMAGTWLRAREIVLDCSNMTTTVTLNNYGLRMNNPIRDSETMGLKTANLSVDNLSLDNYSLQFVRVRSKFALIPEETGNTLTIRLRRSATETVETTVPVDAIVKFGGRAFQHPIGEQIVHATFPAGGVYENVYPHAVEAVKLNDDPWTEIPESIRPDKKASQTLIVNYDIIGAP